MDDHISIVQKNPAPLTLSLDAQGMDPLRAQFFLDMRRDGLHLAVRSTAGNHEVIGKRGKILHLQDGQVDGLVVQCRSGTKESLLFRSRGGQPSALESFV